MADFVKPKKALGQHFLIDMDISKRIGDTLTGEFAKPTLEIGPGTGVLTQFLINRPELDLSVVEIDTESVAYLKRHKIVPENRIL
ncbi:MAG: rRNA adenine N-6-methyltransferase family protein, partial [Flexibacteraceae bacterium]